MEEYRRKINYHETDKMGITHHSNYVKYMEEARIDFLDKIGYSYAALEREGIVSPVIGIECDYKRATTFGDEIIVSISVKELKGVRLTIGYTMTSAETGETVLTGVSKHCFLTPEGKPIALARQFPELYAALEKFTEEG